MRKKWASCSTTGTLTFSQSLFDQPRRFREYVVAHEVLHLSVPNHGRLFKSLMSALIPGWETVAHGRVSGACAARPTRRQT
jgi:predicted metal-dependent hydrolase